MPKSILPTTKQQRVYNKTDEEDDAYHKGDSGDSGPRVAQGSSGELCVAEVAGEHDGNKSDGVIRHVG